MADLAARIAETAAFIEQQLAAEETTAGHAGPARVAWLTLRNADGSMNYTTVAAGVNSEFDEPWCADGREITGPASVLVVYDPARSRRRAAATRELVAAIMAEPHLPVEGTRDDAGGPCDCGRDARVARLLSIIASEWAAGG